MPMEYVPYVAIMAAFALIYLPRQIVSREMNRLEGGYDNQEPRAQQAKLEGVGRRALAAHHNSFEAFAPFAAGVLAAVQRSANAAAVASICIAFVVVRSIYILAYLRDRGGLRSGAWSVGMIAIAALMGLAIAGCRSSEPSSELQPAVRERTTLPPSTTVAHEPAPPPSASDLVSDGKHWRIATAHGPIHVWVPRGYNPKRAELVLYVHGFYTNVDEAWDEHHLPYQFAASAIDAMFVACEAPAGLEEAVSWPELEPLLAAVEAGIGQPRPKRRIVALGHSGAYRTLLGWLADTNLDTVILLDAAYGEIESYKNWVNASTKHRLIDVGDDTKQWTEELHKELPATVTLDEFPPVEDEIPKEAARAKILYIRSTMGHFPLVTGGIAIPMVLRTLRGKKLLDVPLAELVETP
jgi:uncharacterized MAPEG superfamily protein